MNQTCSNSWCQKNFKVKEQDKKRLEKIALIFNGKKEAIPLPTQCPKCREQQRLSFRNEWNFYHRKCDLSGKKVLSIYSEDKPYKVYEQNIWWSDKFDPLQYGKEFDFSRPFFKQWQELSLTVPRASIHNANSENSEYTNYSGENKNCYLAVGSLFNEDTLYSYRASKCKQICDCYDPVECELCYEVSFSKKLYECAFCRHCHASNGLTLCSHCKECQDCFGCINLRHKKYHIFNKPYTKEEYLKQVKSLKQDFEQAKTQFQEFKNTQPHKAVEALNCENSSGDNLLNCKDCENVFIFKDSEDSAYCSFCEGNQTCMDSNFSNIGELQYFSTNLVKNYQVLFSNFAWYNSSSAYLTSCFNSDHLFGCVSLKKNSYCVLNKQYSKAEYEELVPKIIQHMRDTGEWGQYFPPKYSPFGFNETAGNIEHPITQDEAQSRGWKWNTEREEIKNKKNTYTIPNSIKEVSDEITKEVLYCETTQKPYRITTQELKIYRDLDISIPKKCPDQRYKERVYQRNPHHLWTRTCNKCDDEIQTTYDPRGPEKVYCEGCYLDEVY